MSDIPALIKGCLDNRAHCEVLAVPAFLISFPLFWIFVVTLISRMGWHALAERFPAGDRVTEGESFSMQSLLIGRATRYKNCVGVTAAYDGMGLSVMFLFRPAHPPLFIPWSEIEAVEDKQTFLFNCLALKIRNFDKELMLWGSSRDAVRKAYDSSRGK